MTPFEIAMILLMLVFSITNLKPDPVPRWYAGMIVALSYAAGLFALVAILKGVFQ